MLRRLTFSVVALVILLLTGAFTARAEDWPTYRHDRLRTAVTSEKLPLSLVNVWMFRSRGSQFAPARQLNRSDRSSPTGRYGHKHGAYFPLLPDQTRFALPITAAGDSLFFTTAGGRVVCLEAATSKVRWEFVAGAAISQPANVFGGRLYAGSDDGYVYCLDAKTGALVWKYKAAPADRWFISFGRMSSKWPVRTDVFVDDGAAYFGAGIFPHDGMFVYKLDAQSGDRIWQGKCHDYGGSGPVLLSKTKLYLQIDTKGFGSRGWHPEFRRTDGVFEWTTPDPETYSVRKPQDFGSDVIKDGIRYTAFGAYETKDEHKRGKRKTVWSAPMPPGRFPDGTTFIYAGGTLYFLANDASMWAYPNAQNGYGGAVFARDPKTGEDIWSFSFPERPFHLIIANGRLFVSTRGGTIYAFGPKGTPGHGITGESIALDLFPRSKARDDIGLVTHRIIETAAVKKGYAVVLDCDSGVLAYDLARRTDLYVCAVFTDAQKAAAAREKFSKANVLASRISVWRQAPGARLPYASNFADLIVSEGAAAGGALPADNGEISRLLKPIRGVALVGGRQEKAALDKWAADTKQKVWTVFKKHEMHWAKRVRPPIPNGGGWVGPLGGPERTNCSHDKALKGPLAVAWYGQPYIRGSVGRPPLIANGVMLCPTDTNTLEAYDQYNGRQLWKYTANNFGRYFSSTGCAGGNYAFTVYYGRCLRLDLWNGGPPVEVPNPFPGAQWGQITLSRGGKTLWGTGHAKKWRGMFAIDVTGGQTLWKCGGPDEGMKWGGWSAVADGRMFIVGGKAEGEQREQALSETRAYLKAHDAKRLDAFEKTLAKRRTVVLAALDATTGRVLYEHGIDLTNRGGFYGAAGGRLVFGRVARAGGRARKHWGIQYGPRPGFGMAASDGATGKLVWNELGDIRFPPVVTNDAIHAESWVVDLKTGKRRQRPHPISGKPSDQVWARMGKHCGGYNGSENFIFGRSYGVGYFDTLNDSGIYVSMHSRNNCNPDVASGGGMMIKPPLNLGCRCPWSLPFTVAMAQAQVQPEVPFLYFRSGHALPVKHMRLNFGAAGERRDAKGNLWLRVERSVGGHMKDYQINYQTKMVFHEGADWSRRNVLQSSVHTRIENTDTPFVFTTAKRGLKSCVLPVTKAGEGKGTYTVRLGFSAPPGDKLGQRVFDVKLNGKVLLKDFDIVKEAGKTDRAVWKETTLEPDGDLVIEFVAAEPKPSLDQMPLLSAVEIIRKEITTLGFKSPRALWLGGSKLAKVVDVELANLRPSASSGKIVIKAPKGFEVSVTDDVALELPVGGRTKSAVTVKADGKAKPGVHWVKMKIVGAGGKVELEHKLAVEWLGDLEQRVLRGGVRQFRSPGPHWGLVLSGRTFFAVSEGAGKTGDAGLPYAGFPVGIPKELYGKIKSVRVRLHASPSQRRVLASLFSSPRDSGPLKRGDWGIVRQLKGPPWPDLNKVVFPARPETLPEKVKLRPTKWDPNVVEAPVPGSIDHVTKSHQIYLAIEPTELNGPVYWNDRAGDREKAPALIVDYDPRPARPDK